MSKKVLINELLLVIGTMIWGCAFVFQDLGMKYVSPFTFNVSRCMVGSLFLLIVSLIIKGINKKRNIEIVKKSKYKLLKGSLLVGLFTAGAMACQQYGIVYEGSGKSGFITSLYIIFVPLLGLLLKKKISPMIIIGIIFGVTGLYLINFDGTSFTFGPGTIFLVACAILYAIQILFVDYFTKECDSIDLTAGTFFVAGLLQIPFMLILETITIDGLINATWSILFTGVLSSGIAFCLQMQTQKYIPANIASMIMSLESVFSVLFGILIIHESYHLIQFIGCGLIFMAVIASQLKLKANNEHKKTIET